MADDKNDKLIETISLVRKEVTERLNTKEEGLFCKVTPKNGRKGRFENCMWIDVIFAGDKNKAASILFFEDAIIDSSSGNLHPGRYGYVVFQKWNNHTLKRTAPNLVLRMGNEVGVFVPISGKYRLETGICVDEADENTVADKIVKRFIKFVNA